jgi:hypothetical protein
VTPDQKHLYRFEWEDDVYYVVETSFEEALETFREAIVDQSDGELVRDDVGQPDSIIRMEGTVLP